MIRSADVIEKLKADVSSDDFIARDFSADGAAGALLYVDGMSDKLLLEQSVVKPLFSMKWAGVGIADVKKLPYGEEIKEIEETAACIMAIISDETDIPLDELQFRRIQAL